MAVQGIARCPPWQEQQNEHLGNTDDQVTRKGKVVSLYTQEGETLCPNVLGILQGSWVLPLFLFFLSRHLALCLLASFISQNLLREATTSESLLLPPALPVSLTLLHRSRLLNT